MCRGGPDAGASVRSVDERIEPRSCDSRFASAYRLLTAREAHDWFLQMMREHEQFEVETDKAGEWPVPFWSETVKQVVTFRYPKTIRHYEKEASS